MSGIGRSKKSECRVCGCDSEKPFVINMKPERFRILGGSPSIKGVNYRFCLACGYISHPDASDEEAAVHYQSDFKREGMKKKAKAIVAMREAKANFIYNILERHLPKDKGRALDVGSYFGSMVKVMRDHGWDAIGVEPAPVMIEFAREFYGIDLVQNLYTANLFDKASFDMVNLTNVLEHLENPLSMLKDINYNLKTGGYLYIEGPCIETVQYNQIGNLHLNIMSFFSLRRQLDNAGFDIVFLNHKGYGNSERNRLSCLARKSSECRSEFARAGIFKARLNYMYTVCKTYLSIVMEMARYIKRKVLNIREDEGRKSDA